MAKSQDEQWRGLVICEFCGIYQPLTGRAACVECLPMLAREGALLVSLARVALSMELPPIALA